MADDETVDPTAARLEAAAASGCAESRMLLTRRALLGLSAGLFSAAVLPRWAEASTGFDPRLLVVILRGGLDGVNTVVPHGDPWYETMRREVAFARADTIALDGFFGLNPAMPRFGALFAAGEAAVVHATCPPLRNRSHFDAQDNLETGLPGRASNATGWLNRLLTALPAGAPIKTAGAIEIGGAPLILRGPAPVLGWSPSWFWPMDPTTTGNIRNLYAALDPAMLRELDLGLRADALASGQGSDDGDLGTLRKGFRGAARLLAAAAGPRIAVLSVDGFDTHSRQGLLGGTLAGLLGELDLGLDDFRTLIGDSWSRTVVLCVTEFGRSVAVNGASGTDHGIGTAALLAGGAVAGGRVVADWPGLAPAGLVDGDLAATTDLRAVFKGVLREHLDVPASLLDSQVFPGSAGIAPLSGLVRSTAAPTASASLEFASYNPAPLRPETALARYRRARRKAARRA